MYGHKLLHLRTIGHNYDSYMNAHDEVIIRTLQRILSGRLIHVARTGDKKNIYKILAKKKKT